MVVDSESLYLVEVSIFRLGVALVGSEIFRWLVRYSES